MKKPLIIGAILVHFAIQGFGAGKTGCYPVQGTLDLHGTTFDRNSYYNLNGEWEFYWQQLLTPESYPVEKAKGNGIMVRVPSYWESYEVNGEPLPGQGYGTYALTIILPEGHQGGFCIDIPVFDVAFTMYLNDWIVGRNGKVGTSMDEEEPWYEPSHFCYAPQEDTLLMLIQVSNFHHRRGGFWQSVNVGGPKEVLGRVERHKMYNYSTIGVLFFFFIFFLIFWLFYRKEKLLLLFALTALGILMRSVNTGLYFSNSFVYTPWAWQIRMEYLGTYLAHITGMMFLHTMFYRKYMKWVIVGNTAITSILIVSVFALPPGSFTYGMLVFQPLIMIFMLFYLVISFTGVLRLKINDTIFFFSLAVFIYSLVSDIMLANSAGSVSHNYISQLAFQVFILAMAVLIIIQWVTNLNTRVQLEASLRFKTKVLSVIAHDLKNPVASVAQFSDLLVHKPELAGKEKVITSLQESSQAAVNLLDNLLYWGRSQADELAVSAVDFDMRELVTDVERLFRHMATQKDVEISTVVPGEIPVHADRALINIIIRNLVSNAIKFTPGKGRVTIQARKDDDRVQVSVADTGIGIKEEIIREFRSGGKVRSSLGTDNEIGTGLGLQLVRDLVEKNGGTLVIESEPNRGSKFTFTLPGGKNRTDA